MRVLVCDDAVFMRKMITDMLVNLGHQVVGEAGNGLEALEQYKKLLPDLVTMDLTMPEIDGLQGVKMIKEFDPKANIIMCSAMGQQAMVLDAIRSGAKDFIVKPFQKGRIEEAILKLK